jgi:ketosteroid isomerase-like protein
MRSSIRFALCIACWLTTAAAQLPVVAEKEIRDLEAKRFHAMEKADVVTLEGILSDDLIYTHADGKSQSKSDVLGTLGSSEMKYESIIPYDTRVHIYNDTAVVTGRASIKIKAHGQEESFAICYLDVYAKQDGRWQMVAWQSSRIPTQHSQSLTCDVRTNMFAPA